MTAAGPGWSRAFGVLALLAALALYFPLGASGAVCLLWLLAALTAWVGGDLRPRRNGGLWLLAWLGWMATSALWSPAAAQDMLRQGAHYAALLAIPLLATAVPRQGAQRALYAFVAASLLLAAVWAWHALWPWPPGRLLSGMVHYTGNKSIANGLLMALACALALQFALDAGPAPRRRAIWAAAALVLGASVLAFSAARTAHVALALLAAAVLWCHQRRWWPRLALLAGAAALAASVTLGLGGLGARSSAGQLDASNRHRAVLYQETARMVAERPLLGHGLAGWAALWPQRSPPAELRSFNTAHNLPLELAAEGGLPALALLGGAVWAWARRARRAGLAGAGSMAMLVLLAWGVAGVFNAALRDGVFALPLSVLLALGLAAARPPASDGS